MWRLVSFLAALLAPVGPMATALAQSGAPLPGLQLGGSQLALSAVFAGENKPITRGLNWRVFRLENNGEPTLMAQAATSDPVFPLPPGEYVVHVAFGLAGSTRKVLIGAGTTTERVPLAAGALVVRGTIADQAIPLTRMQISVFIPSPGNSEGRQVTGNLKPGDVLRLPEGSYHVVSTYADSNSIVRADIKVNSGGITEAEMRHRAATVTLKLVSTPGGEARANTAWSVLTPGGDVIREAIGAFPSMTLAEGEYVAIARNSGTIHQGEFKVTAGRDRDIEVLAKDNPTTPPASQPSARSN